MAAEDFCTMKDTGEEEQQFRQSRVAGGESDGERKGREDCEDGDHACGPQTLTESMSLMNALCVCFLYKLVEKRNHY